MSDDETNDDGQPPATAPVLDIIANDATRRVAFCSSCRKDVMSAIGGNNCSICGRLLRGHIASVKSPIHQHRVRQLREAFFHDYEPSTELMRTYCMQLAAAVERWEQSRHAIDRQRRLAEIETLTHALEAARAAQRPLRLPGRPQRIATGRTTRRADRPDAGDARFARARSRRLRRRRSFPHVGSASRDRTRDRTWRSCVRSGSRPDRHHAAARRGATTTRRARHRRNARHDRETAARLVPMTTNQLPITENEKGLDDVFIT